MLVRAMLMLTLAAASTGFAQPPSAPIVTMAISLPDGRTQDFTTHEGGVVTVTSKDGAEYGFRPTIQDSHPWTQVTVSIFRMATANSPTELLGDVQLKTGGDALASQTKPSFKIRVTKVAEPPKG